jgi:hypothetical protein
MNAVSALRYFFLAAGLAFFPLTDLVFFAGVAFFLAELGFDTFCNLISSCLLIRAMNGPFCWIYLDVF